MILLLTLFNQQKAPSAAKMYYSIAHYCVCFLYVKSECIFYGIAFYYVKLISLFEVMEIISYVY